MANRVFCNRTLNLKKVKYVGFDMDHTLVRYHTNEFEKLTHDVVVEKLINDKSYPEEIKNIPFEFDRIIRGLVIDQKNGNILKLNMHGAIRSSYHGTKPIPFSRQKKIYRGTMIDLNDANFMSVDTAFSLAYGNLISHLVDLKDGKFFDKLPSYHEISKDILDCVDMAHRDGSLKDVVASNLDKFVIKDPDTVASLERYVKHGKKLFVATNSEYHYTKILLDYAIKPFLKDHKCWSDLFEMVITLSRKPRFFYDNLPFLKINPEDGTMTNVEGSIEKGGIYQGGNANRLTDDLNISGDEILYVGDHIYGDIVRLKKDCNWRTALVLEELHREVATNINTREISDEINSLMEKKSPLELELQDLEDKKRETDEEVDDQKIKHLLSEIGIIDKEIGSLIQKKMKHFNQYWGEVMRTGNEESYFAYQVARYACVYTTNLADLLACSPRTYFRAERRELPHDLV